MTALELIKDLIGNGDESLNKLVVVDIENFSEAYCEREVRSVAIKDGKFVIQL